MFCLVFFQPPNEFFVGFIIVLLVIICTQCRCYHYTPEHHFYLSHIANYINSRPLDKQMASLCHDFFSSIIYSVETTYLFLDSTPPPPRRHKMKYSILIFFHHLSVLHNPTFFIVNHMTSLRQHIHVTPSGKWTFLETLLEPQTS